MQSIRDGRIGIATCLIQRNDTWVDSRFDGTNSKDVP
jgi:hypothetical protein